jgi:hypothetical protein
VAEEGNPHLRASDVDRERVAAALREHCAVGRLTMAELDERLGQAYAARTLGDLAAVTHDLPEIEPELPVPAHDRSTAEHHLPAQPSPAPLSAQDGPISLRQSASWWLGMTIILNAIWLITGITGGFSDYWPAWPMGIGGAIVAAQYVRGYNRRS